MIYNTIKIYDRICFVIKEVKPINNGWWKAKDTKYFICLHPKVGLILIRRSTSSNKIDTIFPYSDNQKWDNATFGVGYPSYTSRIDDFEDVI